MTISDNDKKIIKDAINDMVDSMIRVSAEKDLQKELSKQVKDSTPVSPRVFRKMASVAYKANFAEEQAVNEEFEVLYKEIVSGE